MVRLPPCHLRQLPWWPEARADLVQAESESKTWPAILLKGRLKESERHGGRLAPNWSLLVSGNSRIFSEPPSPRTGCRRCTVKRQPARNVQGPETRVCPVGALGTRGAVSAPARPRSRVGHLRRAEGRNRDGDLCPHRDPDGGAKLVKRNSTVVRPGQVQVYLPGDIHDTRCVTGPALLFRFTERDLNQGGQTRTPSDQVRGEGRRLDRRRVMNPEPKPYGVGFQAAAPQSRIGSVLAAMAMVVLDAAIANVALPTIARSLQVTPATSIWIVTAYQSALVMALLPCAALGESLGHRRVFTAGVALFVGASVLCAFSPSLSWLVAARLLQGLGGAAVMALGIALLRVVVPDQRLGAAIGWNALAVALSSAAGPTIGAAISVRVELAVAVRCEPALGCVGLARHPRATPSQRYGAPAGRP